MKQYQRNLEWLMLRNHLNPTSLAAKMKELTPKDKKSVSQSSIQRIMSGESKDPRDGTLEKIAEYFGYTLKDLKHSDLTGEPTLSQGPEIRGMVPLISWVAAGQWNGLESIDYEPEQWFPCPKKNCENMFALRVSGDSMEPKFQDGDIVFVDPDATADECRIVIAVKASGCGATMKQLVKIDGDTWLKAINPDWPQDKRYMPLESDTYIVGVVIGKWVEC